MQDLPVFWISIIEPNLIKLKDMNRKDLLLPVVGLCTLLFGLPSCSDDNNDVDWGTTALVTVVPYENGSFVMYLDDATILRPINVDKSPFGDKEVRALVSYHDMNYYSRSNEVHPGYGVIGAEVVRLDSIRTKFPAESAGEQNDATYGNDPIEIVDDWVTVAEDGYLTLRVRTLWGPFGTPHTINLLTGSNPDDPFELELRHNANGDMSQNWGDALIAFNLNKLPRDNSDAVTLRLKWKSFSGEKSKEFSLKMRPAKQEIDITGIAHSNEVR